MSARMNLCSSPLDFETALILSIEYVNARRRTRLAGTARPIQEVQDEARAREIGKSSC